MTAWRWSLLLALSAAGLGCTGREAARSAGRQPATIVFRSDTSAGAYFTAAGLSPVLAGVFGEALLWMGEPSFSGAQVPDDVTVLRFLWARSFHPTIVVRVVREPGRCTVITSVQALPQQKWGAPDSTGAQTALSRHPGSILRRDSTDVRALACANLQGDLAGAGLWAATAIDSDGGVDGAEWIFEAADSRGHHVMACWSPDSSRVPRVWRAGMAFLRLGNALPHKAETY